MSSLDSDSPTEALRPSHWPSRLNRAPILRQILFFSAIITVSGVAVWYSMTTMLSSTQVPAFVPQAAIITAPGTNITIPARPAAFGPLISENTNVTFGSSLHERTIPPNELHPSDKIMKFIGSRLAYSEEIIDDNTWEAELVENVDTTALNGFTAPLQVVNSPACQKFEGVQDLEGSIALVERGECSFYDKIKILQGWGAVAVIVGDNVYRRGLVTMYTGK